MHDYLKGRSYPIMSMFFFYLTTPFLKLKMERQHYSYTWFTAQRQKYAAESKYEKLGLSVHHFLYVSVNEFCKCEPAKTNKRI